MSSVNKSVYFYLPNSFLPTLLSLSPLLFLFHPLPSFLSLSLSFYRTRISYLVPDRYKWERFEFLTIQYDVSCAFFVIILYQF